MVVNNLTRVLRTLYIFSVYCSALAVTLLFAAYLFFLERKDMDYINDMLFADGHVLDFLSLFLFMGGILFWKSTLTFSGVSVPKLLLSAILLFTFAIFYKLIIVWMIYLRFG